MGGYARRLTHSSIMRTVALNHNRLPHTTTSHQHCLVRRAHHFSPDDRVSTSALRSQDLLFHFPTSIWSFRRKSFYGLHLVSIIHERYPGRWRFEAQLIYFASSLIRLLCNSTVAAHELSAHVIPAGCHFPPRLRSRLDMNCIIEAFGGRPSGQQLFGLLAACTDLSLFSVPHFLHLAVAACCAFPRLQRIFRSHLHTQGGGTCSFFSSGKRQRKPAAASGSEVEWRFFFFAFFRCFSLLHVVTEIPLPLQHWWYRTSNASLNFHEPMRA